MAWRPPDGLVPIPPPVSDGFRLGEVVVVAHETEAVTAAHLAAHVVEAGYKALPGTEDWQHFRPLSSVWHGIGRHARLRGRDLHVRALRNRVGGGRIYAVGLLTAALERNLGLLGTVYVPAATGGLSVARLAPRDSAARAGSWSGVPRSGS